MKVVIIGKDIELCRAKIEDFEDQTVILISEEMTAHIEATGKIYLHSQERLGDRF